jgi:sulfur carrier protein
MSETAGETLTVSVNGAPRALSAPTLAAALAALGVPRETKHIAIAVNDTVVPRARWQDVELQHDDRVEIITAVAGG